MNSPADRNSIAAHLGRRLVVLVSVVLVVFALAVDGLLVHYLRGEFDHALLAKAQSLSSLLEQDEEDVDFDFSSETMPEFSPGPHAEYFQLWLSSRPRPQGAAALGLHELPRFADRADDARFRDLVLPDGRAGRAVQLDFLVRLDPKEDLDPMRIKRPLATLVTARDCTELKRLIVGLRTGLALLVLTASAVASFLVRRTVSQGLQPLAAVRAQLATLDAATLHARLTVPAHGAELAPVVEQFNSLLAELEHAFHREQTFSAAAAHELRTPLAEIRSLAEVGARFADDRTLASEYFTDIVAAVTQLETLARNLLALARHDSGQRIDPSLEDIDVVAAVVEAWRAQEAGAKARQLTYRYSGPLSARIRAERQTLDLLLSNVLGNAVAHSPTGAEVSIACRVDEGGVALAVANPRGSLEDADLAHIFERFWRKDAARTEEGHAGLGLALVRAYAERLGVQSSAVLNGEGQFVLRLEGFMAASSLA